MNKFLIATAIFAVTIATSCKKEGTNSIPVSASSVEQAYKETGLTVQKPITYNVNSNIGGYLEALPAHYTSYPTLRFPVIIFLHGQGEVGNGSQSSLSVVANNSIPHLIAMKTFPSNFIVNGVNYQFIVLSPQFKSWPQSSDIDAMINYAKSKYRIDTTRLYLAGLSMGGGGVWDYAWNSGKRVTAIVPMAGASYPTTYKGQQIALDSMAVWAFQNNDDPTIPSWYSTNYVQYINQYRPFTPAKVTLWPTGGHDCWTKASDPNYTENGKNIYQWMLSYQKKKK